MNEETAKTPGGEPGVMGTRPGEGTARPATSYYNKTYLTAKDVTEITGVSRCSAYAIIKKLNEELEEKGYVVYRGKISRKYFFERNYF